MEGMRLEEKYWELDEVEFWTSIVRGKDHNPEFSAFVVWFTRDWEIIERHYRTLKGARIAAKTRYKDGKMFRVDTVCVGMFD